jgi:putative ABC transport system permease protein
MTIPLLHDLRHALRALAQRPGYALLVTAILALGVGTATTVFSLVDGVLLRPLPFPDADRLLLVRQKNPQGEWNTSVADFLGIQEQQRSFEAVAAMRVGDTLIGGGEPRWASARWVTADWFRVMGVAPQRGRDFTPGEDQPGAAPVVVIGQRFAEQQFGAGVDPLGRSLILDGRAVTVVGVMPAGFEQAPSARADLWPLLTLDPPTRRGPFMLSTVARLRADVDLDQAAADLDRISQRLFPLWQAGFNDQLARLSPRALHDAVVGGAGGLLWLAFGAVLAVLLIALANIANLVLMRVTERSQDLAVRAALGAGRARLARLLLHKSLLLALAGGVLGVLLAAALLEAYRALGPQLPRLAEIAINGRVALFGVAAAVSAGLLAGGLPLLLGSLAGDGAPRQARGDSAGKRQQWLRGGLVVLEFALALPLLVGAGLLTNSLVRLQQVDPGFATDGLLTARLRLPEARYPDGAAQARFWQQTVEALRGIPGVTAVSMAGGTPPDNAATVNNFDIVGRPAEHGSQPMSPWTPVLDDYFATLGVPLLEGRLFDARDTPDSPPAIVVSRTWAERHFPAGSAVGRQLYEGGNTETPVTIVGVVGDVKWNGLRNPADAVYAPISQGWRSNPIYLYVRSGVAPLALVEPLRAALQRVDPALVPAELGLLERRLHDSLGDERHWTAVIAGFATAAVLLSAVGVFGVLAYYVARQQREIGIRLAIGADAPRIVRLVLRRGLAYALGGTALGLGLSLALSRSLQSLLFGVGHADPATLLAAATLLLLVGLAACWLPARGAARVQPLIALRQD